VAGPPFETPPLPAAVPPCHTVATCGCRLSLNGDGGAFFQANGQAGPFVCGWGVRDERAGRSERVSVDDEGPAFSDSLTLSEMTMAIPDLGSRVDGGESWIELYRRRMPVAITSQRVVKIRRDADEALATGYLALGPTTEGPKRVPRATHVLEIPLPAPSEQANAFLDEEG